MPKSTGDDWVGAPALAKELGVTLRTLYGIFHRGEIPVYRFGRVFRVKRADVDAFVEASRVDPESLWHLTADAETEKSKQRRARTEPGKS